MLQSTRQTSRETSSQVEKKSFTQITSQRPSQQYCSSISIIVGGYASDSHKQQRSNNEDISKKQDYQLNTTKYSKDLLFDDQQSCDSFGNTATTTTQPRCKKNFKAMFNEGTCSSEDDDVSSLITTVKQQTSTDVKINIPGRQALDDGVQNKALKFTTPINRIAFTEDQFTRQDIFGKKLNSTASSNINVSIDKIRKDNSVFKENIFATIKEGSQQQTSSASILFQDTLVTKKPDSAQTTVKINNNDNTITSDIAKATSLNDSIFSVSSNSSASSLFRRPFFLFDDESKLSHDLSNKRKTFDDALDSIWNDPRFKSLKRAQEDIWDKPVISNRESSSIFESSYRQMKKPKQSSIPMTDKFGRKANNNEILSDKSQVFVPFEKLRYSSMSSQRLKHFEFNCFKDKDLRIDDQYIKKLQEITIDDDVETDDDTLDNYIEVCFSDLIEAIDMQ